MINSGARVGGLFIHLERIKNPVETQHIFFSIPVQRSPKILLDILFELCAYWNCVRGRKMLFVYSDHYNCRLSLGGETCLKHLSRTQPWG